MAGRTKPPIDVGQVLAGKYRVERVLGVGGMGAVVAARHLELGELRAVKVLLPEARRDATAVERFMREARIAVRLKNEHVVRIHDVGRLEAGEPYIVMEYLEGQDLKEILQTGPLPWQLAVDFVLQVLEALAEAHAGGLVHRDLKPANIFITRDNDGRPSAKVLDFGISKLVIKQPGSPIDMKKTTGLLGSPFYMPPEQILSTSDVDVRADLWSLGAILYELICGVPPFQGESITLLCVAVLNDPPIPPCRLRPEIPPGLERVVLHCLEKDRERRYPSTVELAVDLASFGGDRAWASVERVRRAFESIDAMSTSRQRALPSLPSPPGFPDAPQEEPTVARPSLEDVETFDTYPKLTPPPATASRPGPTPVFVGSPAWQGASGPGAKPAAGAITSDTWNSRPYPAPIAPPTRRRFRFIGALVVVVVLIGLAGAAAVMLTAQRPARDGSVGANGSAPRSAAQPSGSGEPAADAGSEPGTPKLELVRVAEGDYPIGCDPARNRNCFDDEKPSHTVHLGAFSIMRHEVTVAQYAQCVASGVCARPGHGEGCPGKGQDAEALPIRCIPWDAAQAFCASNHLRLPTEQEWEASARGSDRKSFPWGDEPPTCEQAVIGDGPKGGCGTGGPLAPGARPKDRSWSGALDLGGNVREWTSSDYGAYPGGTSDPERKGKINRGGSWTMKPGNVDASYTRGVDPPDEARPDLGFRCAADG